MLQSKETDQFDTRRLTHVVVSGFRRKKHRNGFVSAAKCEIQKPSTCRVTLFRRKFLSMFPVFYLA